MYIRVIKLKKYDNNKVMVKRSQNLYYMRVDILRSNYIADGPKTMYV